MKWLVFLEYEFGGPDEMFMREEEEEEADSAEEALDRGSEHFDDFLRVWAVPADAVTLRMGAERAPRDF